jgi:predicted  nucleic acid-binding Zn-ribbon protein
MADEKLEDLTLVQLRGIRREMMAMLENQATFSKQITRMYEEIGKLSDEVRALRDDVRRDLRDVKSDIISLESQNISRHGETINAIRRIEALERSGSDQPEDTN